MITGPREFQKDEFWQRKERAGKRIGKPPAFSALQPLHRIAALVAEVCGVSFGDMISGSRERHLAYARHVYFHVARMRTDRSLPQIGNVTGGRDHATVAHGIRAVAKYPEWYAAAVAEALAKLDGQP